LKTLFKKSLPRKHSLCYLCKDPSQPSLQRAGVQMGNRDKSIIPHSTFTLGLSRFFSFKL
jgi:hypothetical protein